jgi:tryptophanyl-tRNA synthetase
MYAERVLSGMRPTGRLHLGHYHGVLKNWVKLQHEYPCLFFVADWHALTTQYDDPRASRRDLGDGHRLAGRRRRSGAGDLFIQSQVPEHAELHLLLSMMTPLGWLERVPTYKDQQEKLENKDLSTYGFLGYPLLQSADILIYRADKVPVGEDQVPHIEFSREIARRFNHLYGREPGFEDKAREAVKKLGKKRARLYEELRTRFQQRATGARSSRRTPARRGAQSLSLGDRERLFGYLEGTGKMILVEPGALLTEASRMPGLDGQKMSKSYGNTITLREDADSVTTRSARMPTDPARVRRTDPAIRTSARSGSCTRCIRTSLQGLGAAGLPQRRHRLPRMQAAGDRRHPARAGADARARAALSRRPGAGARHHRRRQREGAPARPRNDARRARGDGAGLH